MRFLLDTHTTLWWLDSPEKLGETGYRLIADPANDILISPVVPWELAIKANKGKIPLHPLVTDFLKVITMQQYTRKALRVMGPHTIALAEAEGLMGHAQSVRVRMR